MLILMLIRFINIYVPIASHENNCVYNWYCFIFLDDHTRVILKESNGEDYINASYISVSLISDFTVEKKPRVIMRIFFLWIL